MTGDVLIVDDEADIRDLVAGILDDEGYAVRTAADSEQALSAIRARRPSLLVLDIWMQGGGMDGLELLDLVKSLDADVPVIMISGHGNIETAVSAIKRGAYDFLEKPFKSDRLLLLVERAIEAAGAEAGEPASAHAHRRARRVPRRLLGRPAAAPDHRQGRIGQQPRADHRSRRRGEGDGRTAHPCRQPQGPGASSCPSAPPA